MILRARVVVTTAGAPIENGAVAISGRRIVDVGRFDEIRTRNSGEVVDLGEQALLPGLINAHCHLDYTALRGKIPRPKSFTDWIRCINAEKAKLSPDDYVSSINDGFAEAQRFGTTTIANLTAFPDLVTRISAPITTWWFAELIDVRGKADVDLAADALRTNEHWGLAPHAPFTASADLYRDCERIAPLLTTHLAESREEMSMFREASGPLYEFLKGIGREMSDCGGRTPLKTFLTMRDVSTRSANAQGRPSLEMTERWIVAHLNELAETDFALLENLTGKFSIVHCPRSHAYFEHSAFQFEQLAALGINICLGTDSLASNDDLSLFAEMRAFRDQFPRVSAERILTMVTSNAARALGQSDTIGRIAAGFTADLVAVPYAGSSDVLAEIIAAERPSWMMLNGQAVG